MSKKKSIQNPVFSALLDGLVCSVQDAANFSEHRQIAKILLHFFETVIL
jgi:hypothetical protein